MSDARKSWVALPLMLRVYVEDSISSGIRIKLSKANSADETPSNRDIFRHEAEALRRALELLQETSVSEKESKL